MAGDGTPSRALLSRLIDDAALFPPARDPMGEALPGHVERRTSPFGWMLGRFLVSGAGLDSLTGTLEEDVPMELGLILPADPDEDPLATIDNDPRLTLTGIELGPAFGDTRPFAARPSVPVYKEIDRSGDLDEQLDTIAADSLLAKLRTGGLEAGAFPSIAELASFITGCVQRDLGFKCTAGLHHAIAHTDETTGFEHHGFVNILGATHAALTGEDPTPSLAELDGAVLAGTLSSLSTAEATRVRGSFHGFGSCDFYEPVEDLIGLDLAADIAQ